MTGTKLTTTTAAVAIAALLGLGLGLAACGDDPAPSEPDAAPCTIPVDGECRGNVVARCVADAEVTEDCTATQATCTRGAAGFACVDECAQAGVTEIATCAGDNLTSCATVGGRHVVVTDACQVGQTCAQPTGQPAACTVDLCAPIGPLGLCNDDMLVRCSDGAPAVTDCTATNQVCGYGGDAAGYACVAPGAAFVVTGTVRYEDRPPLTSGALAAITPVVARGAEVTVVLDQGSTVLATAHTSDDGSYTLRYDTTAGAMVHVMVTARSTVALRPIRVQRAQNQVHAFGGPSFAAAAIVEHDLLVTDASALSEAFNILDQAVSAMDTIRDDLGATPVMLTARWSRGSNQGTYYSNRSIVLLGSTSDDDGYDDTVILHEIGHFVEDTIGRSDSPGGSHDGSPTDPTLAWSEGFSTYFNMAVRGAPHYMDSNSGGGWGYNADTSLTRAMAGGAIGQDVSEDMVSECLWDLGDGGSGDDDPAISASHADVLRVAPAYLATATLRSVGVSGVDLVDFLDGWLVAEGLASCTGTRGVITTTHAFPYDYAGPAGACP